MRRLRQMVETITERLKAEDYRERTLLTWSTRSIAQFIAAFGGKESIEIAQRLSLIDVPERVATVDSKMNSAGSMLQLAQGLSRGGYQ